MKAHLSTAIMLGLCGAALLTACGAKPGDGAEKNGVAPANAPAVAAGMPANWRATDACSIIDKATMGEVLGVPVTETSLALVHEPGVADAGTSECTYLLGDDRASVMTRWSPIGDNSEGVIKAARSTLNQTLKMFGNGKVEDVPGLGKASLWVDKIGQLQTFIGEDRMVLITIPSGPGAKDKAIVLAKKAGA